MDLAEVLLMSSDDEMIFDPDQSFFDESDDITLFNPLQLLLDLDDPLEGIPFFTLLSSSKIRPKTTIL